MQNLLDKKTAGLLAEAVHSELFASYLYKHIANQMQRAGYFGAQKWFLKESDDELAHYQKLVDFFNDMGSVATLPALPAQSDALGTLREALQLAFDTELQLMRDYAEWYAKCDPVTQQFLLQFLEIQRKSVGEYGDWLARLNRAGNNPAAELLIDQEMGQ